MQEDTMSASIVNHNGADVTTKEFRDYLEGLCWEAVGKEPIRGKVQGVNELARQKRVSPSQISKVLNGAIPGDDFLSRFGFKRRITIVKK
jgi:hypothetical protein